MGVAETDRRAQLRRRPAELENSIESIESVIEDSIESIESVKMQGAKLLPRAQIWTKRTGTKRKVLFVAIDDVTKSRIMNKLQDSDYEILTSSTDNLALEILGKMDVDLVFSNVDNGRKFIAEVQRKNIPHVDIIAAAAAAAAYKLGACSSQQKGLKREYDEQPSGKEQESSKYDEQPSGKEQESSKKPRIVWEKDLNDLFVEVVHGLRKLGKHATPKEILKGMNQICMREKQKVGPLTEEQVERLRELGDRTKEQVGRLKKEQVGSHLQKHRKKTELPQPLPEQHLDCQPPIQNEPTLPLLPPEQHDMQQIQPEQLLPSMPFNGVTSLIGNGVNNRHQSGMFTTDQWFQSSEDMQHPF